MPRTNKTALTPPRRRPRNIRIWPRHASIQGTATILPRTAIPYKVETRPGTLECFDGFPDESLLQLFVAISIYNLPCRLIWESLKGWAD